MVFVFVFMYLGLDSVREEKEGLAAMMCLMMGGPAHSAGVQIEHHSRAAAAILYQDLVHRLYWYLVQTFCTSALVYIYCTATHLEFFFITTQYGNFQMKIIGTGGNIYIVFRGQKVGSCLLSYFPYLHA